MTQPRVVVVGAGIAGLTTAYRIRERARRAGAPVSVTVLEATDRVGGNIHTEDAGGFTVEWGPNGFLDNQPSTLDLARDLGLQAELQPADERAATRFIWKNGSLRQLPAGPASFLMSSVLSLRGRLRVLLEPLQPRGPIDRDESVRDFGVRRIGAEAADTLIDAMVSGVFAGDASSLSLPSAFPRMREMEAEHGSLMRAMVARMSRRSGAGRASGGGPSGPGGTLTSFRRGMSTLPQALADAMGSALRTAVPVRGISPDSGDGSWCVHLSDGEDLIADEVVFAVPARAAAAVLRDVGPSVASELDETPVAGLAVVALGFSEEALRGAPDGFGFLIPRSEGLRSLGCLRDSSIFPGRAPSGHALLRVMIGGAHDPEAVDAEESDLVETVLRELGTTLGITAQPVLTRVIRHPRGIAQYNVGHGERLGSIEQSLARLPGLSLTGSAYHGVAMNACTARADRDAEMILRRIGGSGE